MRPVAVAALLLLAFAGGQQSTASTVSPTPASQKPDTTSLLQFGQSRDRTLANGQTHTYEIALERDQYLHAIAIPSGIDITISLLAPSGDLLLVVNLSPDQVAAEEIFAVTEHQGRHWLKVTSGSDAPAAGRYVIRLEPTNIAGVDDVARVAARRTLETAVDLSHSFEPSSWRRAAPLFEEAVAGFERIDDRSQLARALFEAAWNASPPDSALTNRALALYRDLGDELGVARTLNVLGRVEERRGQLADAAKTLAQAIALHQRDGNRAEEAVALNQIGGVYGRSGEPERGIDALQRALRIADELHLGTVRIMALNNLGIATKDLGDFRMALNYYERAVAAARARSDRNAELIALVNVANLHRIVGDQRQSLAANQRALELARAVGNVDFEARALNGLGSTYYRLGDFQAALDHHDASLKIRRAANDRSAEAASLDAGGRALHRLGRTDEAIERMSEALQIRRAFAERLGESDTLLHLAQVERDRGNLTGALVHIEAAVRLTDTLRGQVLSPESRASFIAAEQERYELYIDVLMHLDRERPDHGFDVRALEASESGRARVLLESLREAGADIRQGADPALLERERTEQRQIDAASRRLSRSLSGNAVPGESDVARRDFAAASARLREIELEIRKKSPRYAALTQPNPLTVAGIQRDLIDAETILLEYSLGETQSWLWVVAAEGVSSFELPPRRQVEELARRVYQGLTARQPRTGESAGARSTRLKQSDLALRDDSAELGRMVLGKAAAHLGTAWRGRRLLIVAADVLQFLPFTALPDPGADGQSLLLHHEVVHLPSASVLSQIRQQTDGRPVPPKQLAVIADPVFERDDPRVAAGRGRGTAPAATRESVSVAARARRSVEVLSEGRIPQLSRLPFTRDEARAISAMARPDQRLEATDFLASRATVMSGDLAAFRLVHLATHGFFNSEQPDLSGLVLSLLDRAGQPQDGFLRLGDIYNLRLQADVVVLSACQTALGDAIRGEGIIGLTRGFMYAGARSVVASLWQVDDHATAELMRAFYRGMLIEGLRPAAALRQAQRQLAKDPRWVSPFYWSAFVMQGEWR